MTAPTLVWFRQDLRLADNPALSEAMARGGPVVALYVLEEEPDEPWPLGAAARWWLHGSITALAAALDRHGVPLLLRRGPARREVPAVAAEAGAAAVLWNRRYEPAACARDAALKERLRTAGLTVESYNAALLHEPWTVTTAAGAPFRVFTPFWRACLGKPEPAPPLPVPERIPGPPSAARSLPLDELDLLPTAPDWAGGLRAHWQPGEAAARARLAAFLAEGPGEGLAGYADERNRPDRDSTSRLSPHLRFGEIGPRQIWHAVRTAAAARPEASRGAESLLREVGWREFSAHLLFHNPDLPEEPLNRQFADFPWRPDRRTLRRWQRGRTGYPIVDAGMRQLWETGWMHNRVRMVAASFLIKDLLQPWQAGERWFWDTLVDADLANNAASWQWVAGCGADAAPFFRVFNPVLQGEKFDPEGAYVRRHVPELARLPAAWIHRPWLAPPAVLRQAGVTIGESYPAPLVDHAAARDTALAAFAAVKG